LRGVGDGDGVGWVVGGGLLVVVVGLGLATGLGACVAGSVASGEAVVASGLGVALGLALGLDVAAGSRATTGASLADCGTEAMRSAAAVSLRVKVSTVAVAIVVTTAAMATLWVLLVRMGVLLAGVRACGGRGCVGGIGNARDSLSVDLLLGRIV